MCPQEMGIQASCLSACVLVPPQYTQTCFPTPQHSTGYGFRGPFRGGRSPRVAHLDLPWADVKLLQDVDEEVLNLHPWVDAVGAIQDNDDVHVGLAPWKVGTRSQLPEEPVSAKVSDFLDDC